VPDRRSCTPKKAREAGPPGHSLAYGGP
jgi:hypothetical protein